MKNYVAGILMVFLIVTTGFLAHAASLPGQEDAGVININTATEDQLAMLPLISKDLARNIINYRNSNGPFNSIDELRKVKGMNRVKLDDLRPWLVTKGDTTFDPDLYNSGSPGSVE
jgi:competence ComEA-like helix-hairpin-helix protein